MDVQLAFRQTADQVVGHGQNLSRFADAGTTDLILRSEP